MSSPTWEIMLAVNDYRNGNFLGRVEKVELISRDSSDIALELENHFSPPATIAFAVKGNKARIGRKMFAIKGYATWVGNWCWDAILVDAETAAAILNYLSSLKLHDQRKFTPQAGWTALWGLYEQGAFSADALEKARTTGE